MNRHNRLLFILPHPSNDNFNYPGVVLADFGSSTDDPDDDRWL